MHHAFARIQRLCQQVTQLGFMVGADDEVAHRQLQGVFLEAVQARPRRGFDELAIHTQMAVAPVFGPTRQVGVQPLAVDHQGREQTNVLAFVVAQDLRGDALGRLGTHFGTIVHTVLQTQLHIKQAQEMPHLGRGGDCAFAATPRETLLNGHGWRYAVDRIHLRSARRLHQAACIGVE